MQNSELLTAVEEYVKPVLRSAFEQKYRREVQLAQARLKKDIQARLSKLPEYKRQFADKAIKNILGKYYGEPESKVGPIIFVLLEALERTDYRELLEHIADASRRDIATLADTLSEFGLADMARLAEQARARVAFLDQLERLALDATTKEVEMHKALERNLWVFGAEFSLFSSNATLRRQIEDYLSKDFVGNNPEKSPICF